MRVCMRMRGRVGMDARVCVCVCVCVCVHASLPASASDYRLLPLCLRVRSMCVSLRLCACVHALVHVYMVEDVFGRKYVWLFVWLLVYFGIVGMRMWLCVYIVAYVCDCVLMY